ncbi:MAG: aldehyde dehydrogenase family protein [Phycisphaeraceae bacterium]|nr:aldehyde dehydrogenase family protein [Phycisphaeraceae bacterium]
MERSNLIVELAAATRDLPAASMALAERDVRAGLLEAIAAALDAARVEIITTTAEETALLPAELEPEFDRMTGTLRMFAALVREGSWVRAAIDMPNSHSQREGAGGRTNTGAPPLIGPNHDIRRMLVPLGPVAVFGASNFPLAYGVCGGDTASALAAGCPVIVKEHPAHPKTGRLIHRITFAAAAGVGAAGALGYIHNEDPTDHSVAKALVQHAAVAAAGFTGSTRGGIAIHNLAATRTSRDGTPDPIPVFAEMGSCNVIIVLRHAFNRHAEAIADEVAASLLARVGQQCTAPSVMLIAGYDKAEWMYTALADRIARAPKRRMLSSSVAANYYARLDEVMASGAIEDHTTYPSPAERDASLGVPVVLYTQAVKMEDAPRLWDEIFGPGLIVAGCGSMAHGYFCTPKALTVAVYAEAEDLAADDTALLDEAFIGTTVEIVREVRQRAGRIVFNGVTTGVRVCTSTVHGGPFPATNRPDTTAVGPLAIERWCRPLCFQNCPDALLPPELQDANPLGIWRMVNGRPTREPVCRGGV